MVRNQTTIYMLQLDVRFKKYVEIPLRPTAYFSTLSTWIPLFYTFSMETVNERKILKTYGKAGLRPRVPRECWNGSCHADPGQEQDAFQQTT